MPGQPITIATAGHVDHGKTTLVRALTGHDTDRLPDEKRRGMSIEPGFAPFDLPGAPPISVIDVPGHERFVRHMVAGASGVDAFLLCVAADDGVMPQTREHLMVLELLGVNQGVVAITKSDRHDPSKAGKDVRDALGDDIAVIPVSAVTGEGLSELRDALVDLTEGLSRRPASGPTRLFVDRAFTLSGAGTVVTGTLWGAALSVGETLRVEPGGQEVRVRRLHVHGSPRERVEAGRVAVNMAGIAPRDIPRGSCLVAAGSEIASTDEIRATIDWRAPVDRPLRSRRRMQMFIGTAEVSVRCRLVSTPEVLTGETATAELRAERAVAACAGDPFVLRDGGRTVGGGVVLPPTRTETPGEVPAAETASPKLLADVGEELASRGLTGLGADGLAETVGATQRPVARALRELMGRREVVSIGDRFVDAATLEAAVGAACARLKDRPQTLGDLRDLWGVGRDRAVDIAEYMDSRGLSQRKGNARVAGPERFASDS